MRIFLTNYNHLMTRIGGHSAPKKKKKPEEEEEENTRID